MSAIPPLSPPPKFSPSPAPVQEGDWISFFRWLKNMWQTVTNTATVVVALPPPFPSNSVPHPAQRPDLALTNHSGPAPQKLRDSEAVTVGSLGRAIAGRVVPGYPPGYPVRQQAAKPADPLTSLVAMSLGRGYQLQAKIASGAHFADAEVPAGAQNGVNQTYTLANAPNPALSLLLYFNGVLFLHGVDYTLSGLTITLLSAKPDSSLNEWLVAWYRF